MQLVIVRVCSGHISLILFSAALPFGIWSGLKYLLGKHTGDCETLRSLKSLQSFIKGRFVFPKAQAFTTMAHFPTNTPPNKLTRSVDSTLASTETCEVQAHHSIPPLQPTPRKRKYADTTGVVLESPKRLRISRQETDRDVWHLDDQEIISTFQNFL